MCFTIYPIYNGNFSVGFKALGPDLPNISNVHSFVFLLAHEDGELFLVDTGFSPDHIPGVNSQCMQNAEHKLDHAITALGFNPADISAVIQTHLHWDHTAGMFLFPAARFFVQADEFRALFELNPNEETYYAPHHWLPILSQIDLLNGSVELKPGLRVLVTGYHTMGHQVIEVQTRKGKVILGGDAPFNYDELWKAIPPDRWDIYKQGPGKNFYWSEDVLPRIEDFLKAHDCWEKSSPEPLDRSQLGVPKKMLFYSHDPRLIKKDVLP